MLLGAIAHIGAGVAIIHTAPLAPGLVGLSALTWYDEDHVLAITQAAAGTRLWDVPVNGAGPILKSAQPGMTSIAADGQQNNLYVGMTGGQLENEAVLGGIWRDFTAGSYATYPG
jgi:hypothetical protein